MVRPTLTLEFYIIDVKKIINKPVPMIWGDGELHVNDKIIYTAKGLQVGLFDNLIYDFGGDPTSDTF